MESKNEVDELTMGLQKLDIAKEEALRHFEVQSVSKKYDDVNELAAVFEGKDLSEFNALTLSGNSYGTDACFWIAEHVLKNWTNLVYVNFSNIFVSRLREEIPKSLKAMMDAVMDKKIRHLDVSHNAFGPQGVETFEHFLT